MAFPAVAANVPGGQSSAREILRALCGELALQQAGGLTDLESGGLTDLE
jgi:hypothetical protein